MQIGLTKKLSDYTGIKIALADASIDPLFSWSANLLTIHRKKTIVCMNDASRFAFILYGVKTADVKKLDQLIVGGIRQCMATEAIDPQIVERYLLEGSSDPSASAVFLYENLESKGRSGAQSGLHVCGEHGRARSGRISFTRTRAGIEPDRLFY